MELIDTEEKAKEKICVEMRAVSIGGYRDSARNSEFDGPTMIRATQCVGSRCMMFRYDGNTSQFFCGKAGKP